MQRNITELARVIRSKNAGPYELTLDIVFDREDVYREVRRRGLITREVLAGLYGLEPGEIRKLVFFDPARAVKAVLARRIVSGSPGDTDVYGAQQHAPLLQLVLDIESPIP